MGDTTIILQGGIWKGTLKTAESYCNLPFVDKVIISTWKTEKPLSLIDSNVEMLYNDRPEYAGGGNMNLQIVSSRNALKFVETPIAVKMRTDQKVSDDSMMMMDKFFEKFEDSPTLQYHDGTYPVSPIFTIGMNNKLPYHPQDHIFWGYVEDLNLLFDLPYSTWPEYGDRQRIDYSKELRPNIYLGSHYYAKFDDKVNEHINSPEVYLLDCAPKFNESMERYNLIRDDVFKVFPKIDMYWEKYNTAYWYEEYIPQGEYYYENEHAWW